MVEEDWNSEIKKMIDTVVKEKRAKFLRLQQKKSSIIQRKKTIFRAMLIELKYIQEEIEKTERQIRTISEN